MLSSTLNVMAGRLMPGHAAAPAPVSSARPSTRLLQFGFNDRVDIQNAVFRDLSPDWRTLAPGLQAAQLNLRCPRGPLSINVLRIASGAKGLTVRPILAGPALEDRAALPEIARQHKMLAGINASYFRVQPGRTGLPLGAMVLNGKLVTGPLYQRTTLAVTRDGAFRIGRPKLHGGLQTPNGELPVDNLNQLPTPRNESISRHAPWKELIAYTARWGKTAPAMEPGLAQVQIRQGRIQKISTTETLSIPPDGAVLAGPADKLAALQVGMLATLNLSLGADWTDVQSAISAGPTLIKGGKIVFSDRSDERFTPYNEELGGFEPRSAAGVTDGGELLLVTVDGRQPGHSVGLSVLETARLMLALGAVEAINLDGGGSSQMVIGEQVINRPAELPLRPVPTALGVFRSPPDAGDRKAHPSEKIKAENTHQP